MMRMRDGDENKLTRWWASDTSVTGVWMDGIEKKMKASRDQRQSSQRKTWVWGA